MAPFDAFCAVTGWRYMDYDEFLGHISGDVQGIDLWNTEDDSDDESDHDIAELRKSLAHKERPSEVVQNGLRYTEEDIYATVEYVLVVPQVRSELPVFNEGTVKYVFNVYPLLADPGSDQGFYIQEQGDSEVIYESVGRESLLINFCAFLIMQHLIPEMEAHVFYNLVLAVDGKYKCAVFSDVDYGPVGRIHEQDVQWTHIGEIEDEDEDEGIHGFEVERWWLRLLTQKGKSDEEILEDAWMGRGNMWVFKHPGLFPIEEAGKKHRQHLALQLEQYMTVNRDLGPSKPPALLSLPLELMETMLGYLSPEDALHFVCSTSFLYGQFHAGLDKTVYAWIRRERPWYLPVGPVQCEKGDEEVVRWKTGWQQTIILGKEEYEKRIPWFAYHLACKRSPNMRSRERIWNIVLQIKDILNNTVVNP